MKIEKRNERVLDQFYTNEDVAKNCFVFFNKIVVDEKLFYLEPSAGTGIFLELFPKNVSLGLDLEPKHKRVIKMDFFNFNADFLNVEEKIATIGNPPFGKNSSLAIKFINKAAMFSKYVAFILPKSFKKESIVNRIDKRLHLIGEMELEDNSFNFVGVRYSVPCVFQVWEVRDVIREVKGSSLEHSDFKFVSKNDADFAIRRVGGLAGKIIFNFCNYSICSHYFIKGISGDCREIFEKINWDSVKNNTAGNPSISKREVVRLYNDTKFYLKKLVEKTE